MMSISMLKATPSCCILCNARAASTLIDPLAQWPHACPTSGNASYSHNIAKRPLGLSTFTADALKAVGKLQNS